MGGKLMTKKHPPEKTIQGDAKSFFGKDFPCQLRRSQNYLDVIIQQLL